MCGRHGQRVEVGECSFAAKRSAGRRCLAATRPRMSQLQAEHRCTIDGRRGLERSDGGMQRPLPEVNGTRRSRPEAKPGVGGGWDSLLSMPEVGRSRASKYRGSVPGRFKGRG